MKCRILFITLTVLLLYSLYAANITVSAEESKDEPISRQSVIAALIRTAGLPDTSETGDVIFFDMNDTDEECRDAITKAVNAGIVTGYTENGNSFLKPNEPISCLEALVLLSRCLPDTTQTFEPVTLPEGLPDWAAQELNNLPVKWFEKLVPDNAEKIMASVSCTQVDAMCTGLSEIVAVSGSLSHPGYTLEEVVILGRHNIRAPLSTDGSFLDEITPYSWFRWTSDSGELSLRGGVLETIMGQYFRKWMESEAFIPENYIPAEEEFRFYSNSYQRTIATARYFSSGLLPLANTNVEYHMTIGEFDPVFRLKFDYMSDAYRQDIIKQLADMYKVDDIAKVTEAAGLEDNYSLLSDVIALTESNAYRDGSVGALRTDDSVFTFETDHAPELTGSLITGNQISDALVLQYYEEDDPIKAAFGKELTRSQWIQISEIMDVFSDVLITPPLVSAHMAHPMLTEIQNELNNDNRKFTLICGHDINVVSVLAALDAENYTLPGSIQPKTPIGVKLVFSKWLSEAGEEYLSLDLVYQTTSQMRNLTMLDTDTPPAVFPVSLKGLERNADSLYSFSELEARLTEAIDEYDILRNRYME